MKNNTHIADTDFALYAMGALSQEETDQAKAHLAVCALCADELRQTTLALATYAQTTPEVELPAGARQRFMARVAQVADEPAEKPAVVPQKAAPARPELKLEKKSWSIGWGFALAGALAIALLAVGVDDNRKSAEIGPLLAAAQRGQIDSAKLDQLMELLTSNQAQKVSLHETAPAKRQPEGRVVYAAHSGKLLLTASNLHPLPAGKIYELWILQPGGKAPLPAGTFAPDSSGNAAMILADEPADLAVAGFGVTIENAGGAESPTLPIVLSGQ